MTDTNGRILVVDDQPDVADVLVSYFTDKGYAVSTAHHGGDAVMLAAVDRPDVILLDILMPGVDGVEALRRIRAIDPTIPIIMVTGNCDERTARDTLMIGAFDYVPKPFDFAVLDRVVEAALVSSRTGEWRTPARRVPRPERAKTRADIAAMLQVIDGGQRRRDAASG